MIALFTLFAEPIRVLSRAICQFSSSIEGVAMLLDPAGHFFMIGCLVVARVLKISVAWEVMVSILCLSFLFIGLLG